mmetsp:Transcript_1054/g.1720  ORF Transcript_1054/g.1720 Transcript_1054/m.1720 type:complete len:218 (-) Transcript_1054:1667-2320(-)
MWCCLKQNRLASRGVAVNHDTRKKNEPIPSCYQMLFGVLVQIRFLVVFLKRLLAECTFHHVITKGRSLLNDPHRQPAKKGFVLVSISVLGWNKVGRERGVDFGSLHHIGESVETKHNHIVSLFAGIVVLAVATIVRCDHAVQEIQQDFNPGAASSNVFISPRISIIIISTAADTTTTICNIASQLLTSQGIFVRQTGQGAHGDQGNFQLVIICIRRQ